MQSPNSVDRRNGRILLALGLVCGGILLSGAKAVTDDLRHRPQHLQEVDATLQAWSRTLTQGTETPGRFSPVPLSKSQALLLVRSCSLTRPSTDGNSADGPK